MNPLVPAPFSSAKLQGTLVYPATSRRELGKLRVRSRKSPVIMNTNRRPSLSTHSRENWMPREGASDFGSLPRRYRAPDSAPLHVPNAAASSSVPCNRPTVGQCHSCGSLHREKSWTLRWAAIFQRLTEPSSGGPIRNCRVSSHASAMDNFIRAFDSNPARNLEVRLPRAANRLHDYTLNGQQYLVIAAGGHGNSAQTRRFGPSVYAP